MKLANSMLVFSAAASTYLLASLLDAAFKGMLLMLLVMIACALMYRATAATRHLTVFAALVAILIMPLISLMIPHWQVLPSWAHPRLDAKPPSVSNLEDFDLQPELLPMTETNISKSNVNDAANRADVSPVQIVSTHAKISPADSGHAIDGPIGSFQTVILLSVWIAGVAIMLCPTVIGFLAIRRIKKNSLESTDEKLQSTCRQISRDLGLRTPRILIGDNHSMPMVWGVINGKILLPASSRSWNDQRLRAVLLHELAHLKRLDPLTLLIGQFARAVYWFNPLIWWAVARLKKEQERACDDFVLRHGVKPSCYANDLLELVTVLRPCRQTTTVSLAMADRLSIESRLSAILEIGMNRRALSRRTTACVTIAAMVFCVGLAAIQAQDEAQPSQSQLDDDPIVSAASTTSDEFAWNRTDKYVPPNFVEYFPEKDEAGAKRLGEFMNSSRLRTDKPDEYIEAVRRGLRSTQLHKTSVLRMLGNTFIWGKEPQNEKAIELMYHASGADDGGVVHYAMYFGPTVVVDRSDNLMRMMMLNHHRFGHEIQRRLNWSFSTIGDQVKTADQLASLLNDADELGEYATIAAHDYYKKLTKNDPPQPERFAKLGKWAIGFSHVEVEASQPDGTQQLREMLGQFLDVPDDEVIEYVGRIDKNKWVGVTLVGGIANRDAIAKRIDEAEGFSLEFADRLDQRLFQKRRLREFAKHFDGNLVNARPEYTLPELDRNFAWNRQDKFDAPNFENFFPDDAAAGKRLDDLIDNRNELELSDREILDAFRQGLKRSEKSGNHKLSFLSSALGWPADPYTTEIMFQASALDAPQDIQYYAVYYGLGNWWDKSDNVLRQFAELFAQPVKQGDHSARNMHQRILWSVRNNEDEKSAFGKHIVSKLEKHEELDDSTLARLIQTYEELTKKSPPNLGDFEDRGFFFLIWQRSDQRDESIDSMSNYQATLEQLPGFPEEKIVWHAVQQKSQAVGIGLVRGFDPYHWLMDELQSDDLNSVLFGGVWPEPWDLREGFPSPQELEKFFQKNK